MRIDADARAKRILQPSRIASFGDGAIDELQLVALGDFQPRLKKIQTLLNGECAEKSPRIDDLCAMHFEIAGTRGREGQLDSRAQFCLKFEPLLLRHHEGTEHKDGLGGIVQIVSRITGLIEVNEMHGRPLGIV